MYKAGRQNRCRIKLAIAYHAPHSIRERQSNKTLPLDLSRGGATVGDVRGNWSRLEGPWTTCSGAAPGSRLEQVGDIDPCAEKLLEWMLNSRNGRLKGLQFNLYTL